MRRFPQLALLTLFALALLSLAPLPGLFGPATSEAAPFELPPGFVDELIVDGLTAPTAMAWAPDGRIFIAHKDGRVSLVANGQLQAAPFVDIAAQVNSFWDRGLIGLAVHPQFPAQPFVYLLYTHDPPGLPCNRAAGDRADCPDGQGARVAQLLRVRADPSHNHNRALPAGQSDARTVLMGTNSTLANSGNVTSFNDFANAACRDDAAQTFVQDCLPADGRSHSVGDLLFAPDGALFVSNGDASDWVGLDTRMIYAQHLDSMAGKVFRIDPITGAGLADNPFFDAANPNSNRSKLYSYGLRNPFRIALHPTSGEPYIGDVGGAAWEEVNMGRGANFGWPCYEGGRDANGYRSVRRSGFQTNSACVTLYNAESANPPLATAPLLSYPRPGDSGRPAPPNINHDGTALAASDRPVRGQSITVGDFYRGDSYPAPWRGALFISDFNNEWIKALEANGTTIRHFTADTVSQYDGVVQLRSGPDTNLYYIYFTSNHNSNTNPGASSQIRRIRYTGGGNRQPVARIAASPTSGSWPLTVRFSSQGSYDPDAQQLSYSWNFGNGSTSTQANPEHTYTQVGTFTAVLTVSDGSGGSAEARIAITVGNTAPTAEILTPTTGTRFSVGDVIAFSGRADDPEEGQLPAERLRWEVLLNHNDHVHADFFNASGANGLFTAPDHGDGTAITVCLTATDSQGLRSRAACRELPPNTVDYSFESDPPGLTLGYGEMSRAAPFTQATIVGSNVLLAAPLIQAQRSFDRWDHGGPAEQLVAVGGAARTFTARYINRPPVALPAAQPSGTIWPVTVAFSGTLSFDPEQANLSYRWEFGDGQQASGPTPSHRYARPGSYQAVLTVTDELGATTTSQPLTIAVANNPPVAALDPLGTTSYVVGTPIRFNGRASDVEDGELSGEQLVWQIFRVAGESSELLASFTGAGGEYTVEQPLGLAELEIRLTARDQNGGTDVRSVRLAPPPGSLLFLPSVRR